MISEAGGPLGCDRKRWLCMRSCAVAFAIVFDECPGSPQTEPLYPKYSPLTELIEKTKGLIVVMNLPASRDDPAEAQVSIRLDRRNPPLIVDSLQIGIDGTSDVAEMLEELRAEIAYSGTCMSLGYSVRTRSASDMAACTFVVRSVSSRWTAWIRRYRGRLAGRARRSRASNSAASDAVHVCRRNQSCVNGAPVRKRTSVGRPLAVTRARRSSPVGGLGRASRAPSPRRKPQQRSRIVRDRQH
jgi:hypothetical protein